MFSLSSVSMVALRFKVFVMFPPVMTVRVLKKTFSVLFQKLPSDFYIRLIATFYDLFDCTLLFVSNSQL